MTVCRGGGGSVETARAEQAAAPERRSQTPIGDCLARRRRVDEGARAGVDAHVGNFLPVELEEQQIWSATIRFAGALTQ